MNSDQVIRDLTYPMKSITPMKKPKVLQTFGNRKNFSYPWEGEKANRRGEFSYKAQFF